MCLFFIGLLYAKEMRSWQEIKSEFHRDGTLRDIYISDCNSDLWNSFLKLILNSEYMTKFKHGKTQISLPLSFAEIKSLQKKEPTTLFIFLDKNIQINCHFFIESEIELNVSPQEIRSEDEYNQLVSFLSWLSSSLHREVCLTHEGSPNMKIIMINHITKHTNLDAFVA